MSEPQVRVVNVWSRLAWAVVLGAATALMVAWLPAIAPVDKWTGTQLQGTRSAIVPLQLSGQHERGRAVHIAISSGMLEDAVWLAAFELPRHDDQAAAGSKPAANIGSSLWVINDVSRLDRTLINDLPPGASFNEYQVGWPWRALAWRHFRLPVTTKSGRTFDGRYGVLDLGTASPWVVHTLLPVLPLWTGMFGNIAVMSVAWFALLTLPRLARGLEWRRKRQCPACGYSLQSVPERGCPECGWDRQPAVAPAAGH